MNISEFRSGEYEQQYEYRSFQPTPINQEWIVSDPQILTLQLGASLSISTLVVRSTQLPPVYNVGESGYEDASHRLWETV
jgi:hypothetical protein